METILYTTIIIVVNKKIKIIADKPGRIKSSWIKLGLEIPRTVRGIIEESEQMDQFNFSQSIEDPTQSLPEFNPRPISTRFHSDSRFPPIHLSSFTCIILYA